MCFGFRRAQDGSGESACPADVAREGAVGGAVGGVAGLLPGRSGPKGPSKLTPARVAQIVERHAAGLTLLAIAARTGVSTATVRVALGRVGAATKRAAEPLPDDDQDDEDDEDDDDDDFGDHRCVRPAEMVSVAAGGQPGEVAELVVLAAPVPRTAERAAARSGEFVEAPVLITQGSQLPLAGLLLALPGLAMTGLLQVAEQVFRPMRKGFYGLRATLLMGVFMALLREPRAEGATTMCARSIGQRSGISQTG